MVPHAFWLSTGLTNHSLDERTVGRIRHFLPFNEKIFLKLLNLLLLLLFMAKNGHKANKFGYFCGVKLDEFLILNKTNISLTQPINLTID